VARWPGGQVANEYYTTDGVIRGGKFYATGKSNGEKISGGEPEQVTPGGPFNSFIAACRSRKISDLNADVEHGHYSSALCHLGNIAYRVGEQTKFTDTPPTTTIGDNQQAAVDRYEVLNHRKKQARESRRLTFGEEMEDFIAAELPQRVDDLEERQIALRGCMQRMEKGDALRISQNAGKSTPLAHDPTQFAGIEEIESALAHSRDERRKNWLAHSAELSNDPRLLLYYPMSQAGNSDREITDSSANDITGSIVRADRVSDRWGFANAALDFTPAGSRVRVEVPGEHQSLTLYCWARIDSLDRWFNSLRPTTCFRSATGRTTQITNRFVQFTTRSIQHPSFIHERAPLRVQSQRLSRDIRGEHPPLPNHAGRRRKIPQRSSTAFGFGKFKIHRRLLLQHPASIERSTRVINHTKTLSVSAIDGNLSHRSHEPRKNLQTFHAAIHQPDKRFAALMGFL
jgi:hypothetical protein